jgi:hypothetical protein
MICVFVVNSQYAFRLPIIVLGELPVFPATVSKRRPGPLMVWWRGGRRRFGSVPKQTQQNGPFRLYPAISMKLSILSRRS